MSTLSQMLNWFNFDGFYMRNDILKIKPTSTFKQYLINLDSSDGPGTHWVSVIISNKYLIYYDSFALKPPQELQQIKSAYMLKLFYNNVVHQKISNSDCGELVIKFSRMVRQIIRTVPEGQDKAINILRRIDSYLNLSL